MKAKHARLMTATPFIEGRPVRAYNGAAYSQSIPGANVVIEAEKLGANAIPAVDPDYDTFGPHGAMMMVSVSGTAVVL